MANFLRVASLAFAITVAICGNSLAATIVIPASQDTYVRAGTASTNYNALGLLSSRSGNSGTAHRGILQFDLSGVTDPIVDARLEFYQMPDAGNTANYSHNAWLLPDTAVLPPIDETTFDYNVFNAAGAYNAQLIDTPLGDLSLADASGAAGDNTYRASATTSDSTVLTFLNNRRTSGDPTQRYAFIFTDPTTGTSRVWGDHEGADQTGNIVLNPAQPALLVLNTVPEPQAWILWSFGLSALGWLGLRRHK